ncbi:kinase-like protein [Gymnopus androsaceus JB14]|uniref:non-specific serine/threonine protein kinase n=1 Tax=Gymnopus androsaceus JB14 TaxID=1447944 RepID=A0A6A4GK87_9AGAR|nr:kinase-like protein [Gymnopus androsaceus JB14]
MNHCYYATHNQHHARFNYSDDLSTSDLDTASSSTILSTTTDSSSSVVPRRMDLVNLDMIKLINTGGSSKVYLVRDKIDRQHLALKAKVTTEKNIHAFLTTESDDFVLLLVATWSDRENFYLASEYVPGGDLALRIMQQRTFDKAEARFYIAKLVVALERLHARKIIHRDIKPSNILIRPDGYIVLADFGLSKRFSDSSENMDNSFYTDSDGSSSSSSQYSSALKHIDAGISVDSDPSAYMTSDDCGTAYFMSPEQHRGDRYSFKVDYWAVGVILYRMVMGEMPFGDSALHKGQIARSVLEDDVSFVGHSSTISMVTQDFILGLLAKDPCHRLHPSELRKDPFFYGIDWSLVESREMEVPWLPYVAPIPKQSRAIFAGYRELHPSCYVDDIASFTWYSPYARLRHIKSLPRTTKAVSGNNNSSSSTFDGRWKSWIRSVFCASDGRGSTTRNRRKGWIAV